MIERLRETFREEAREILADLKGNLLKLESHPGDPEAIGWIFRALHTLKGAGELAGFKEMAGFARELEPIYEGVRSGRITVDASLLSLSLAAGELLQRFLQEEDLTRDDPQAVALMAALRPHQPNSGMPLEDIGKVALELGREGATTYRIRFRPPADLFQRGVNPMGLMRELAGLGPCRSIAQVDAIPLLPQLDPHKCYLYWDIILSTQHSIKEIRDIFYFVEMESQVDIERLEDTSDEAREGAASNRSDLFRETPAAGAPGRRSAQSLRPQRVTQRSGLDKLVDLIGELDTVQARLSQILQQRNDSDLLTISEEAERLTGDLREQVRGIRTLATGTTFSGLLAGATIQGNGTVALTLDTATLIALARQAEEAALRTD